MFEHIPLLARLEEAYNQLPCYVRAFACCTFVVVKFVISFFVMRYMIAYIHGDDFGTAGVSQLNEARRLPVMRKSGIFRGGTRSVSHDSKQEVQILPTEGRGSAAEHIDTDTATNSFANNNGGDPKPFRILHIVTALAEKNNGTRGTIRGEDRLAELLVPVLQYSVESMLTQPGWEVDVYLVLGWSMKPERRKIIEDALPPGVGLEVWDDATPIGYDRHKKRNGGRYKARDEQLSEITRALARQHRYVIKDKLDEYDLFSVWVSITYPLVEQCIKCFRFLKDSCTLRCCIV